MYSATPIYISPLTQKLMGLSTGTKKNIVTIALLAAAIGPLLLVIGKVIGSIGTIIKIGSMLFSKVGLIIAVIAAAAAGLVYLWKTNENFRSAVVQIWERIKNTVLNAVNVIKEWWAKNGQAIIDAVVSALTRVWETVKTIFGKIKPYAKAVWEFVKDVVKDTVTAIKNWWSKYGKKIWNTVKSVFTKIWQAVKSAFNNIKDALGKLFSYAYPIWEKLKSLFASLWDTVCELYETLKPVFELIGGLVMTLWGVVSSVLAGIIDALGPFLEAVIDVVNAILDIIKIVCAVLRGDWSSAWEYMQDFASNIWSGIKNIFLGIWEFIKGFGESLVNFFGDCGETIGNIFKSVWEGISGFFTNIWEGIKSVCSWIWDSITSLFSKIGDFFKNLFSEAFNWGKNLITNIGDGIKSAWNWVVDGVKSVGQSIADFLGFGSPTKKGPGHTADEWIPNLMDMMAEGMYADLPMMQRAAMEVANTLNLAVSPNRAVIGTGSSPNGDLLNGLLQGMAAMNGLGNDSGDEVVLQIDGQTFARLMMPKLNKEYKRNGVKLQGV